MKNDIFIKDIYNLLNGLLNTVSGLYRVIMIHNKDMNLNRNTMNSNISKVTIELS